MRKRDYGIAILPSDSGIVGVSAYERKEDGSLKLLESVTYVGDGGVDPESGTKLDSKRYVAGVARRQRRCVKRKRGRKKALREMLELDGFPVEKAMNLVEWDGKVKNNLSVHIRATAASGFIPDEDKRRMAIAVSCINISARSGYKNAYMPYSLMAEASAEPSDLYEGYYADVCNWQDANGLEMDPGVSLSFGPGDVPVVTHDPWPVGDDGVAIRPTPSQLAERTVSDNPGPGNAIRRSHAGEVGPDGEPVVAAAIGKLHQSDYYHELRLIFRTQGYPDDMAERYARVLFERVNPRDVGAAAKNAGKCSLQPSIPRAPKSSVTGQEFRICDVIGNLRVVDPQAETGERRLAPAEFSAVFALLNDIKCISKGITWEDVAAAVGVPRGELAGIGGTTPDGEPVSSTEPPFNKTLLSMRDLLKGPAYAGVRKWWDAADSLHRDMLVMSLGNAGIDAGSLDGDEIDALDEVDALLSGLPEEALDKLRGASLEPGRFKYGLATMRSLVDYMLAKACDLSTARADVFGKDPDWRPPADPLGSSVGGSTSVDWIISMVSRAVRAIVAKYGEPARIVVGNGRYGTKSRKARNAEKRANDKRHGARVGKARELAAQAGIDPTLVSDADVRKALLVKRQHGECMYCGSPITPTAARVDHIVGRRGGGCSNARHNVVAVCRPCADSKNGALFSEWATDSIKSAAAKRVGKLDLGDMALSRKAAAKFKREMRAALVQTVEDDPVSGPSGEDVAWAMRELAHQLEGFLAESGYASTSVAAFGMPTVAAGMKASRFGHSLPWHGGFAGVNGFDMRSPAVEALFLLTLDQHVAHILSIREDMRIASRFDPTAKWCADWRDFGMDDVSFAKWHDETVPAVEELARDAMERGRVHIYYPRRLKLGNSAAHKATIEKMTVREVGDALPAALIDTASSKALYCALTRCPDYDRYTGLPENPDRVIRVHGDVLTATDKIRFMCPPDGSASSKTAAIAVRGGYAKVGNSIHHARVYFYPVGKEGSEKWRFGILRVFQNDLLGCREDVFKAELPPQSLSMRYAEDNLRYAILDGKAHFVDVLVVGDTVSVDATSDMFSADGDSVLALFAKAFPGVSEFVITGFPGNTRVRIAPAPISSSGNTEFAKLKARIERAESDIATAREYRDGSLKPKEAERVERAMKGAYCRDADEYIASLRDDIAAFRARQAELRLRFYGSAFFTDKDIEQIDSVIGGRVFPSANSLFSNAIAVKRRGTLGWERWKSNGGLMTCWKVPDLPDGDRS